MQSIKSDFAPNIFVDPVSKEVEITYQPKATIFVKMNGILYPFAISAYVDSGATRNLFPSDMLKYFNLKLKKGRKRIHYGIGDKEVISYTHEAQILIGKLTINTEIDFSEHHKPYLLGIEKFFKHFDKVIFDMPNSQVEFVYR